ncbi:hypothetical protein HUU62_04790 [Rhodoferax sp. 4810]|nr:hypothetical protein [Rhodoferax jenense]
MSNEHIPTELQEDFDQLKSEFTDENIQQILHEIQQEAAAFDMNAIALAKAALAELVSKEALEIYRRNDKWGTALVNRTNHNGKQYVTKAYTGVLAAQTERETASFLSVRQQRLQWTAGLLSLEFDDHALDENLEIRLPYVGLDLSKWESLLRRSDSHNPFRQVDFYLNLAAAALRALDEFHKTKGNSFVHCDVKLNNFCAEATEINLINSASGGKPHVAGAIDLSKLILIDLGSAFTVEPGARRLPENKTGEGPKWLAVAAGPHVAPSYTNAVALAVKTGNQTHLVQINWKADLYSLGAMIESLLGRYQTYFNSSQGGYEYLSKLPSLLKQYENDSTWPAEQLPHQELIKQIAELPGFRPSLRQKFRVPVNDDEIDDIKRLMGAPEKLERTTEDIENIDSTIDQQHRGQKPTSPRRSKPFVAVLVALCFVAVAVSWLTLAPNTSLKPGSLVTRSDSIFKRCDLLRETSMSNHNPLPGTDYESAIKECTVLLSAQGVSDELRFDALMTRFVAFEKTDQFQLALDDLKTAESIRPDNFGVNLNRALLFFRQHNESEAFKAIQAAKAKGWNDRDLIEKDVDFKELVEHPNYQAVRPKLALNK